MIASRNPKNMTSCRRRSRERKELYLLKQIQKQYFTKSKLTANIGIHFFEEAIQKILLSAQLTQIQEMKDCYGFGYWKSWAQLDPQIPEHEF